MEFETPEDARKIEETVKTGYAESSIETLLQWIAVEEDLADNYGRLSEASSDGSRKGAYTQLRDESKSNIGELARLLKDIEALDRARVRRIELLTGLLS